MKYYLHIFLLLWCYLSEAQDIHFSLFNELPMNMNPALTGAAQATKRAGLIYRNQWNSVSTPFQSSGFFADLKLTPKALKGDDLGVGFQFLNDRSGSGGLKQNHFSFFGNYQKFIDRKQTMMVSGGIQIGIFQKSFDPTKLNFESDFAYESGSFVSNGSYQNLDNSSFTTADITVGACFTHYNKFGKTSTVGVSFAHLNTPEQSFLGSTDPLKVKTTIHGKTVRRFKQNLHLYPSAMILLQNKATEVVAGAELVYSLGNTVVEVTDLKGGIFYRFNDALFFTFGLNHNNWGINFSYDYNSSELGEAAKNVNAFEIAISIRNKLFKSQARRFIVPGNRLL